MAQIVGLRRGVQRPPAIPHQSTRVRHGDIPICFVTLTIAWGTKGKEMLGLFHRQSMMPSGVSAATASRMQAQMCSNAAARTIPGRTTTEQQGSVKALVLAKQRDTRINKMTSVRVRGAGRQRRSEEPTTRGCGVCVGEGGLCTGGRGDRRDRGDHLVPCGLDQLDEPAQPTSPATLGCEDLLTLSWDGPRARQPAGEPGEVCHDRGEGVGLVRHLRGCQGRPM